MRRVLLGILLAVAAVAQVVPKPGAKDLCPVCGMMVAKYPEWTATVVWKDGHAHHFDGAKDLFKFLQAVSKHAPGHKREDVRSLWVTDYYNLRRIDATAAFYVIGSDIVGPMGHELVPLASQSDAEEFRKDHKGKRILRFHEVSASIVSQVDAGQAR